MKSLLTLRNINVENANAISGVTYGFPAISNFLGFTHALSRKIEKKLGLRLGGCAVICHQYQVNAHQPKGWGDYVFALTRNPLTKEGSTAAFVEEGRMAMEVSLLIECDFICENLGSGDFKEEIKAFEDFVREQVLMSRLAGGTILNMEKVVFEELPQDREKIAKFTRKQLLKLMPGFLLVNRSDTLKKHYESLKLSNPDAELIDAWLDFAALKYKAIPNLKENEELTEQAKAHWEYKSKPASGWLVPLAIGFKAISPLYENNEVARSRDPSIPFRFVETVYGIGEWLSPHRIQKFNGIFWRYRAEGEWYLCENNYQAPVQ
ncbi:MAG: type I-F CRISPR-associated protein Csy2 [Pseudomonadota bacterium]